MVFLSIFNPNSPEAHSIYALMIGVIILCVAILVLVVGLIIAACIKSRRRKDPTEPKPDYGNPRLEAFWTSAIFIIVTGLMFFTVRTMVAASPSDTDGKPDLIVVGHQWWWEIRYSLPDGTEAIAANEVHIPVGKRMLLELRAADVIHDFWVPELGRKIDAIPGHPNQIWLEADHAGIFRGFCAEFCGASHAWMKIRVVAENEADFGRWLDHQREPALAPLSAAASRGQEIFKERTCVSCHEISGVSAAVEIGPDLTHVASRETLAAGTLKNTSSELARWLRDPDRVKPGVHMPNFGLSAGEIEDLAAYLGGLR